MVLLQILISSVVSLVILFILTKIMGNKQISQLSMFDYIIGITIGSIAAELATDLEDPVQPATLLSSMVLWRCSFLISARNPIKQGHSLQESLSSS